MAKQWSHKVSTMQRSDFKAGGCQFTLAECASPCYLCFFSSVKIYNIMKLVNLMSLRKTLEKYSGLSI